MFVSIQRPWDPMLGACALVELCKDEAEGSGEVTMAAFREVRMRRREAGTAAGLTSGGTH